MSKNTNAIDKIICELSKRDYFTQWNKLTESQKRKVRNGKMYFSYDLGMDTLESIEVKRNYINNNIDEEEYKSYCLRYNLLNKTIDIQ